MADQHVAGTPFSQGGGHKKVIIKLEEECGAKRTRSEKKKENL